MQRRFLQLGAGLVAVATLATACGSDDDGGTAAKADSPTTMAEHDANDDAAEGKGVGVQTGAADLRAGLTSLLQEHVFLAGAAIATAVQNGGDLEAPAAKSAVATLDANSVALSEAIGSVYGDDAAARFLELWRQHIGFFVDYTLGGATGDQAVQEQAVADLDQYRVDFGTFIETATEGGLSAEAVADDLKMHVSTLVEAVDAVLAGSPDVYTKLKAAADHMPGTAAVLAGAISEQMPEMFSGDAASSASELRAGLTHLLGEHVYLAGLAINQAVADKGDLEAPTTADAVAALDANSVALSEAIGSVYGDDAAAQFLELWRQHIGFFVDYTLGGATGDVAMQDEAKANLDQYRADFGRFVDDATAGKLPAEAVAEDLQVHVSTLVDAVDAVLAGSPDVFPKLRTAASHMPGTALALSGAIAQQMPDELAG